MIARSFANRFTEARSADLDRIASDYVVRQGVALGASVAVAARDEREGWQLALGAAGTTGYERPSAVTPLTPYDLASVTKPIVATALARLAARGDLPLAAPLAELLPEAQGTPSGDVPLELFLAHRAGLRDHLPLFDRLRQRQPIDRGELLRTVASARRPECVGPCPMSGFEPLYSDLGFLLAGAAAERLTHTELDQLIACEVSEPLGLDIGSSRQWLRHSSSFAANVAATEHVLWRSGEIRGVVHDENAWTFSGHGSSGHAGAFGTAASVARFGAALLDAWSGRDESWLDARALEPLLRIRPGGSLRAGFDGKSAGASSAGDRAGPRTFGHLGFTGTSLWCDPDADCVVVLLTNRVCPTRDHLGLRRVRPLIHDALFEAAARS